MGYNLYNIVRVLMWKNSSGGEGVTLPLNMMLYLNVLYSTKTWWVGGGGGSKTCLMC